MSGADGWIRAMRAAAETYSDVPRSWQLAEVLDNSEWSATGPAYLTVRHQGATRRVVLSTPSAQPPLFSAVQIRRSDSDTGAFWLALPLPQPVGSCPGAVYVSAQADGGDWAILKVDLVGGNVWSIRSAHPVSGYDRRPLSSYLGTRLLAWGSSSDLGTPGPLYYSDDAGATWTAAGIDVVNVSATTHYGFGYAVGGADLYQTTDGGATWAAVSGPGGTLYAVDVTSSSLSNYVAVLTDAGVYYQDCYLGDTTGAWDGPFTPGGPGWVEAFTQAAYWWTGGGTYHITGNTPGAGTAINSLPGGDDSSGQSQGSGAPYHSATGATDGGIYTYAETGFAALLFDATGVGAADALTVTGNGPGLWPIDDAGFGAACDVLALQGDVDGARFYAGEVGAGPYAAIDGRQATDLGDRYTASPGGLATLELWETLST